MSRLVLEENQVGELPMKLSSGILTGMLVCFVAPGAVLAQGVDTEIVAPAEAQRMLKALIPAGKKFVAFDAYVAGTNVKDVNLGLSCSSSSTGNTTGTVDSDGNVSARTQTNGSGTCREMHDYYKTMYLGLRDLKNADAGYMITVQCAEKWRWNHCDMPPEKTIYPVVLEIGKRDTFTVYAATSQKLGGKQKVAKFAVLDVSHVVPKNQAQVSANN
jgi:hypothetical protein